MRLSRLAVLVGLTVLEGCFASTPARKVVRTAAPPAEVFVDPNGDDRDDGSAEAPFRTVAHALSVKQPVVRLQPGQHRVGRLFITRPVRIVGTASTTLDGYVFVASKDASIEAVTITGGFEAARSRNLALKQVTVEPGTRDDAVSIVYSTGQIDDLTVRCAPQTCIQVTTSTVTLRRVRLSPSRSTARGLRSTTAHVEIEDLVVASTSQAQLQAELRSRITVRGARMTRARGSAIVALRDSQVRLEQVQTASTAKHAVLVQTSTVIANACRFGPAGRDTLRLQGGDLVATDAFVTAGAAGAATLTAFAGRTAHLELSSGVIWHGDHRGISGKNSRLIARQTRFVGQRGPAGGSAIYVSGPRSQLELTGVHMHSPAGWGVELINDAFGTVTATIARPGLGGVRIAQILDRTIGLSELSVESCGEGPAVRVVDSYVRIRDSHLEGCQAGVLGVEQADVHVHRSVIRRHSRYGIAAFGGASMTIDSSTVTDSPWATFSLCSDESVVAEQGRNRVVGRRGSCW